MPLKDYSRLCFWKNALAITWCQRNI